MTFRAIRLDPEISEGAQGGPEFVTIVSKPESNDEQREGLISNALGKWTIGYKGKRPAWWDGFLDHFYLVGGRRDSWPFKDWLDFRCSVAQSYLLATDGSPPTLFQMYKARTRGGLTYYQKIILPMSGTIAVAGGGSYSVSSTTGIITKSAGADPTGFSCEFDKLCRFDGDHLVQTIEARPNRTETHRGNTDRTIIVSYVGIGVVEIPLTSA